MILTARSGDINIGHRSCNQSIIIWQVFAFLFFDLSDLRFLCFPLATLRQTSQTRQACQTTSYLHGRDEIDADAHFDGSPIKRQLHRTRSSAILTMLTCALRCYGMADLIHSPRMTLLLMSACRIEDNIAGFWLRFLCVKELEIGSHFSMSDYKETLCNLFCLYLCRPTVGVS
jgi:hypothetical protein